jgi:hypothetical protein
MATSGLKGLLDHWYERELDLADDQSPPQLTVASVEGNLVHRLATTPAVELPNDWTAKLRDLAGSRTVAFILWLRGDERPTGIGLADPAQTTLGHGVGGELLALIKVLNEHAATNADLSPQSRAVAHAIDALLHGSPAKDSLRDRIDQLFQNYSVTRLIESIHPAVAAEPPTRAPMNWNETGLTTPTPHENSDSKGRNTVDKSQLSAEEYNVVLSYAGGMNPKDSLVTMPTGVMAKRSNVEGIDLNGRRVYYDLAADQSFGPIRSGKVAVEDVTFLWRTGPVLIYTINE